MKQYNKLRFDSEEVPWCCGALVVGDFSDGGTRNGVALTTDSYEEAVLDLRDKLVRAEGRTDEEDICDGDEDGPFNGCRALIATVPTSWEYRHKLLLDAGMVEVKRWVNVNSGNELALLVSPDEWPPLK